MVTINIGAIMDNVTLDVRIVGTTRLRVRLWCARQLLQLASVIAGCAFVIIPTVTKKGVAG